MAVMSLPELNKRELGIVSLARADVERWRTTQRIPGIMSAAIDPDREPFDVVHIAQHLNEAGIHMGGMTFRFDRKPPVLEFRPSVAGVDFENALARAHVRRVVGEALRDNPDLKVTFK